MQSQGRATASAAGYKRLRECTRILGKLARFRVSHYEQIMLGHGGGGRLTAELIQHAFLAGIRRRRAGSLGGSGNGEFPDRPGPGRPRLAFTTDSFVVKPLFFPGGDIGKLAVNGTVNDLAVGGAIRSISPRRSSSKKGWRSPTSQDRGLDAERLRRWPGSRWSRATPRSSTAAKATRSSSPPRHRTGARRAVALDRGRPARRSHHGLGNDRRSRNRDHVGARGDRVRDRARKRLAPRSIGLTRAMLEACPAFAHARPDPRRSVERLQRAGRRRHESASRSTRQPIPVRAEVRGRLRDARARPALRRQRGKADRRRARRKRPSGLLEVMRAHPLGRNAALIGEVVAEHPGMVTMRSLIGGERIVTIFTGEQLPRIC